MTAHRAWCRGLGVSMVARRSWLPSWPACLPCISGSRSCWLLLSASTVRRRLCSGRPEPPRKRRSPLHLVIWTSAPTPKRPKCPAGPWSEGRRNDAYLTGRNGGGGQSRAGVGLFPKPDLEAAVANATRLARVARGPHHDMRDAIQRLPHLALEHSGPGPEAQRLQPVQGRPQEAA